MNSTSGAMDVVLTVRRVLITCTRLFHSPYGGILIFLKLKKNAHGEDVTRFFLNFVTEVKLDELAKHAIIMQIMHISQSEMQEIRENS